MLMTETEAKKKWCPLVRIATDVGNNEVLVANQREKGDERQYPGCIGSQCMAWRWVHGGKTEDGSTVQALRDGKDIVSPERIVPNWKGYCGAFGKPTFGLTASAAK